MSTALRLTRDLVALEAFSATNVAGLLQDVFPAIREDYAHFTNGFLERSAPIAFAPNTTDFERATGQALYVDLMALSVKIPSGMRGTYLAYLEALHAAATYSLDVMTRVLAPYSLYLSALVNSHDSVISTARIDQPFAAIARERDAVRARLDALLATTDTAESASATYGQVVDRNADWAGVFSATDAVVVMITRVDRSDLHATTCEISTLHEVLERKLARGELDDVSPEALNNLADGAYQVSEELGFFATTYHRVSELSQAITQTVQAVTQVLTETA